MDKIRRYSNTNTISNLNKNNKFENTTYDQVPTKHTFSQLRIILLVEIQSDSDIMRNGAGKITFRISVKINSDAGEKIIILIMRGKVIQEQRLVLCKTKKERYL